jgi:hypothetical protein
MTTKEFKEQCADLELLGWTIDTYEPLEKFAIYRKNGQSKTIGVRK